MITRDWPGPLYLDTSAWIKLYLPEPTSDELDLALVGRTDLIVSHLAVTEIISALARRCREGKMARRAAARLYRTILEDVGAGIYRCAELLPPVHREAERLLLSLDDLPVRAADSLHLAQARASGAVCIVTFDQRMAEAARRIGLGTVP